jgi:outer membrane receptor protein involved in Fe transport
MMQRIWILVVLISLSIGAFGQDGRQGQKGGGARPQAELKGKILDESGSPIPYASIVLYSLRDSSLVTGGVSNDQGDFLITTRPGMFMIKISFLSFEEKTVSPVRITPTGHDMGTITLIEKELDIEATVEAKRPEMELKLDKRVFNIEHNVDNKGANGAEILDNIPSVEVDVDGNVNLRGNTNVRILINGKPSGLVGTSPADALRQLQGSLIDRVEIITNPSARYDAEGEVGIINIILKKERRKGLNGSIDLSAGYPKRYNAGINMNWRLKKINYFISYGLGLHESPGKGSSSQTVTTPQDSTFSYNRLRNHTRGGFSNNVRTGADIFINKRNTLTLTGRYSFSEGSNDAELIYEDLAGETITQTVTRTEDEEEDRNNYEARLMYEKTFALKERKWTIDLAIENSDDNERSDLLETSTSSSVPDIIQRASNTENEFSWVARTDYEHPIGKEKEGKFEVGLKSNFRRIENDFTVEELNITEEWKSIPGLDNFLVYEEAIHAGYMMLGNKVNKFSYQFGLRLEYTDILTELVQTNEVNQRDYFNPFPSAHLSYEFKKRSFVQLSYSRRISRPRFRMLLPFFGISDSRNFYSGNPDLNPTFTHSLETTYLRYTKKGSIMGSLYYRYTEGVVERITINDTAMTLTFPINLSTENSFGVELNASRQLTDWWSIDGNWNFYRAIREGDYNRRSFDTDFYSWNSRINSRMKFFKKKLNYQASLRYRAPRETAQGRYLAFVSINTGFNFDVMSGNGTVTLNVNDLLNSRKYRWIFDEPNFYYEGDFQWRQRQFLVSFNYRINQKKQRGGRSGGEYEGGEMGM